MMTKGEVEAGRLASSQDDLTGKVRRMALLIPAIALFMGTAFAPLEPRYGLFAAALVLGWTRLVGL